MVLKRWDYRNYFDEIKKIIFPSEGKYKLWRETWSNSLYF